MRISMILICAWCQQEDKREILAPENGCASEQQSHGICEPHAALLRQTYQPATGHRLLRLSIRQKFLLSSLRSIKSFMNAANLF